LNKQNKGLGVIKRKGEGKMGGNSKFKKEK
jgi:hypothetical protein